MLVSLSTFQTMFGDTTKPLRRGHKMEEKLQWKNNR